MTTTQRPLAPPPPRQCPYQLWHSHGAHRCWRHHGHDGPHQTDCRRHGDLLEPHTSMTWTGTA